MLENSLASLTFFTMLGNFMSLTHSIQHSTKQSTNTSEHSMLENSLASLTFFTMLGNSISLTRFPFHAKKCLLGLPFLIGPMVSPPWPLVTPLGPGPWLGL